MGPIIDLDQPNDAAALRTAPHDTSFRIRLWAGDGFDEKRDIADGIVQGRQILESFDRRPAEEHELLMLRSGGPGLRRVGLEDTVDLREEGPERFFAFRTAQLWNLLANGVRFPWGAETIAVQLIRLVARIPETQQLVLERRDEPDFALNEEDVVDLTEPGLERIIARAPVWKLNVQGVILTLATPTIVVETALAEAGFDPNEGWTAILKRAGAKKTEVGLHNIIDLRTPGIEKLRLTPKEINNGEVAQPLRRDFDLLDKDEIHLNARGLQWETLVENGRRILLLRGFILPSGLSAPVADIAIDIPPTYPSAEIDMFHCSPHLTKADGSRIPLTDGRSVTVRGKTFQQWSRHLRGVTRWNPATDSVMTHLALVEAALIAEGNGDD
ncbi:MAG: multiubiquitin domain-containing protein [Parvularcula sp.]|jgi:hypothetical protein|nr:multiubiquitin domain-containing protein [Parvularcula sp.]